MVGRKPGGGGWGRLKRAVMNTDLHGFDHRVARLLAVVAHPVDRHVDGQFPHHRFPKGVPVG